MKKNQAALCKIFLAGIALGFAGCNLQIPETVSVKTKAEFNASLGSASYDLSDKLSKDSINSVLKSQFGSTMNLYDLKRTDDTLTYVMQYPIYNVPLDVSSYLETLDLESLMSGDAGINVDQKVTVPEISFSETKQIEIPDVTADILSGMTETLDDKGSASGVAIVEQGSKLSLSSIGIFGGYNSFTVSSDYTKSITYRTGSSIIIEVTKNDSVACGSDFTFPLTATIASEDNTVTYASSGTVEVKNGGKLILDIGTTLPNKVLVTVDGYIDGGVNNTAHSYTIKSYMTSATKIQQITGLSASKLTDLGVTMPEIDETVSLASMTGVFDSAEIGEGSVSIKAVMPSDWVSGVTCTSDIKISGAGMTETSFTDGDADGTTYLVNKKLDLAGKTLAPAEGSSDLSVKGSVNLSLDDAVINFDETNGSKCTINVVVEGAVTKISSAVVNLTKAGVTATYTVDKDSSNKVALPNEMLKYVRGISFNQYKHDTSGNVTTEELDGVGVKFDLLNTLPAGNSIPVSVKSTLFDIDKSDVLPVTGATAAEKKINDYVDVTLPAADDEEDTYVDFSFSIGTTVGTDQVLYLVDIVPGTEYELGVSNVKVLCDFDSIKMNMGGKTVTGHSDIDSLDFTSIFSQMRISEEDYDKIKVDEVDVKLYAQAPTSDATLASLLGDISLVGKIKLTTKASADASEVADYWLGSSDADGKMVLLKNEMKWPENGSVIEEKSDFGQTVLYGETSIKNDDADKTSKVINLADKINEKPYAISIDYNLVMSSDKGDVTVYASQLAAAKESNANVDLKVDMAAIIPFSMTLSDSISMDFMSFVDSEWSTTNKDKDLLSRESASSTEAFAQYADAFEYVKIGYDITNPFSGMNMNLSINDSVVVDGAETHTGLVKEFTMSAGSNDVHLTADEIKSVMTGYPFHPEVKMKFGKDGESSQMVIHRSDLEGEVKLGAKISFGIKMNGEQPITVWGGQ